jgi:outer membrane receptor protein involved in Fe transport
MMRDVGWCSENTNKSISRIDSILISIEFRNTDLKDALKQIMEEANLQIVYNDALIKGKTVSYSFQQEPLSNALNILLAEFNLQYQELESGQIVIIGKMLKNLSVRGFIFDSATSEPLAYANVVVKGTKLGTSSDEDGYFSLNDIPTRQNQLLVHYMGYHPEEIILTSAANSDPIHVPLRKQVLISEEVRIESSQEMIKLNNPEYTTQLTMSPTLIKNLSSLGESNVFQAIEWTPGVSTIHDGISGLRVRGGTNNQNLILFEDIQIYKTDHFFGLVSGFNSEAIQGVQFYRGGFPAKYGGRTSSVLLLNGHSSQSFQNSITAGINLLSVNAGINLNLGEKVSFSISGRRSYTDQIDNGVYRKLQNYIFEIDTTNSSASETGKRIVGKTNPNFYYFDINSKLSIRPNKDDHISINFYKGYDYLDQSYSFTDSLSRNFGNPQTYLDISDWGNVGISCIWNHNFSEKYALSLSGAFSSYVSNSDDGFDRPEDRSKRNLIENSIDELSFKLDNNYAFKENLQFDYGLNLTKNKVKYQFKTNDMITRLDENSEAISSIAYLQSIWKPGPELTVTPGIRITHYSLDKNLYTEPRFSFSYNFYKQLKLSGAYSHHYQFIDQIRYGSVLRAHHQFWILSDSSLKPGFAKHFIAGVNWDSKDYLFSIEAYYKNLDNVKEYIYDDFTNFATEVNRYIYQGTGVAKGIEFLAMKKQGNLSGWLSYTLGRVEYNIPFINNSLSFPANHDRLHEFKIVSIFNLKNWNIGLTWLYAAGANYTPILPSNSNFSGRGTTADYVVGEKNSARLPNYHRLDFNISRMIYYRSMMMDIGISVYNVYNQENIIYRTAFLDRELVRIRDTKMLGTIPSLYLKVSFGK